MPNPLKLASLWRVISDLDLEGVRRTAQQPFTLAIVADSSGAGSRLRQLLSGSSGPPHPWVQLAELLPDASERALVDALSPLSSTPLVGILLCSSADLPARLKLAGNRFAASATPVLTVVIGDTSPAAKVLRPGERSRVAVVSLDESAIEALATALAMMTSEDQQVALGAQFPPLRPVLFARLVERTARANASFALTTGLAETIPVLTAPLNLGDMVVLTKNQLMMCYRIALTAGRNDDPQAMMTEIVGVLGSGVLFRQAARQLVGLIPIAGLLPKVAIAYAGTYAIGKAMVAWLTEGRQVTSDVVSAYAKDGLAKGRALAEHLVEDAGATGGRLVNRIERLRRFLPRKRSPTRPA